MQTRHKYLHWVTAGCVIFSLALLLFCYVCQQNARGDLSLIDYMKIGGLALTILVLPDLLARRCQQSAWFSHTELWTIGLLFVLLVVGRLQAPEFVGLLFPMIGVLGLAYLVHSHSWSWKSLGWLLVTTAVVWVFFGLPIYGLRYHSPLFVERIIVGDARMDPLFHTAIANLFNTYQHATTGLDGAPTFNYHWGSNLLFASLGNLLRVHMIDFYNIGYPAIFLPLFLKSLFLFISSLYGFYRGGSANPLMVVAMLVLFYSTNWTKFRFVKYGLFPMLSESTTLSFIFLFLYGSLLASLSPSARRSPAFLFFSLAVVVAITFLKGPTGAILLGALLFLYLKLHRFRPLPCLYAVGVGLAWLAMVLGWISVQELGAVSPSPYQVYRNWTGVWGWPVQLAGVFFAVLIVLHQQKKWSSQALRRSFWTNRYVHLELLVAATLVACMMGAYLALRGQKMDVMFGILPAIVLTLCFAAVYLHRLWDRAQIPSWFAAWALLGLFLVAVLGDPIRVYAPIIHQYKIQQTWRTEAGIADSPMGQLVDALRGLDDAPGRAKDVVYISPREKWFYDSQTSFPEAIAFVVPALSGRAMIGGLPPAAKVRGFSFPIYRRMPDQYTLEEAMQEARQKGYARVISFSLEGNKVIQQFHGLE